jgi:hypothetical protein
LNLGRFGHTGAAMTTAAREPERREARSADDHARVSREPMALLEARRAVRA